MVQRGLDDYLVGTNTIHFVIHAFALPAHPPFDAKGGELVGGDGQAPAARIGGGPIVSEGDDLGWGTVLVALAQGAEPAGGAAFLGDEVRGPSSSFRRDNHPSAMNGVFSQLGHDRSL